MRSGRNLHFVLHDGERVCFLGDSITTAGFYAKDVSAACTKVYPERKICFFNCGNPGDTTVEGLARLKQDVLAVEPSWVVIALGINDVRDTTLYRYHRNMREIITRSKAIGARVMLMTPTVYDDDPVKQSAAGTAGYTAEMLNNEAVEYHNRALVQMTKEIVTLAKTYDCRVADVYTPFKQLIKQRQQEKHSLDLLPDRLHPSEEGHLVMALAVLKGFGMTNTEIERSGLNIPTAVRAVFRLGIKPARR